MLVAAVVFSASCSANRATAVPNTEPPVRAENAVDVNTASAEELARIPHIGPKLASAIVEFRSRHGRFRRAEHLMLIRGISDNRFREIRAFVKTE